jgi:hypothetical protein
MWPMTRTCSPSRGTLKKSAAAEAVQGDTAGSCWVGDYFVLGGSASLGCFQSIFNL